jgi:hypothetical protein
MAIAPREGRWGLSRIVQASDGGWDTVALRDGLAEVIECFYPPLNAAKTAYTLPFALIRLDGAIGTPTADTRLIPQRLLSATLGDLTAQQRNTLRNQLNEWLTGYSFTDWDGTPVTKATFNASGYNNATPIRQILLDIFAHLGHSEARPKVGLTETHNTEYLEDFSTNPSGRWTVVGTAPTWDSVNSEWDFLSTAQPRARYSANDPGSIEHECQSTAVVSSNRSNGPAVRYDSADANTMYSLSFGGTNSTAPQKYVAGVRTGLGAFATTAAAGDFTTTRIAASGAVGANVELSFWGVGHGATKPSDPGWYGVDGSPTGTYTDTSVDRLDDATNSHCGIGGRGTTGEIDSRNCYWKSRAIADRGGGSNALAGDATGGATASATLDPIPVPLAGDAAAGATAEGAATVTAALAGDAQAGATASGALSAAGDIALAGEAIAGATASADLTVAAQLAGAATGGAGASGTLTGPPHNWFLRLNNTAHAWATRTASIGAGTNALAGDATGGATGSGQLTISGALAAAGQVGALADGALTVTVPLAGVAIGGATASGAATVTASLLGAAIGSGLASGSLNSAPIALEGSAIAGASANGTLTVTIALSGSALGSALASAGLTFTAAPAWFPRITGTTAQTWALREQPIGPVALFGDAVAGATASGDLTNTPTGANALEGDAVGLGQASGTLTVGTIDGGGTIGIELAGDAVAGATASGAISVQAPLAGAAVGGALASGNLSNTPLGGVALAGNAVGSAQASGALTLTINLSGAAVGSGLANATVLVNVPISAAAVTGALASGVLLVRVVLSGAAIAGGQASGQLLKGVSLAGNAVAGATAQGQVSVAGVVSLQGNAIGGATASGTLKPNTEYHGSGLKHYEEDPTLRDVRDYWDTREAAQREKRLVELVSLIAMIDEAA